MDTFLRCLKYKLLKFSGNFRQEYHSESSPKHATTDESEPELESPGSRYIHFNANPYNIFKETDI